MKLFKICFLLLTLTPVVFSQNIDSLFQEYLRFRGEVKDSDYTTITTGSSQSGKCGFGIAHQLMQNINQLSPAKQSQLETLMSRPERDTSIVSPDGTFRIHYDLTGSQAPAYFLDNDKNPIIDSSVNALAAAFDSSYNYEVKFLGYPPHLPDDGLGGDDRYDVYVGDIGPPLYGETVFETGLSENRYISFIRIDNDFGPGFPEGSNGINGAMVTAAHEYHHAIQLGNYGFFSSERYFYELTSTSMEEFVFDEVNDYYNYLDSYFLRPYYDFTSYDGYDLAVWNLYLQQKFERQGNSNKGFDIIKRCWEILPKEKVALLSISEALFEQGTTFKHEFSDFALWCYFTDYRANPSLYFEEGENYLLIKMQEYYYTPPKKKYELRTLEPTSNYYQEFILNTDDSKDTLISIITNHDINSSNSSPLITISADYYLLTENEPGATHIVNEYYSIIESENLGLLLESNIFNRIIVSGDTIERKTVDYAFPQPFRYSTDEFLFIPTINNGLGFADLNIYTTGMDLVYHGRESIIAGDKIVVRWDARDSNSNKLPTGVYIYVTDSEENVIEGKLVIYND